MKTTAPALIVCMHELPLEYTGGGVLLREILRHFTQYRRVFALYPSYPHQASKVTEINAALTTESITPLPLPIVRDWGHISFTLRRLFSHRPGSIVSTDHIGNSNILNKLDAAEPNAQWLAISPFALSYVPKQTPSTRISLYFTNVDEDIVVAATCSLRQRIEGKLEQIRIQRWVASASRRAGRLAAITPNSAATLSTNLRRPVTYAQPLMAPKPLNCSQIQRGLALITTNYTYAHNRASMEWFIHKVWPLTKDQLQLEVTGLDDTYSSLARLLASTPRAKYLGFLPKPDLETAFARSAVVINPTISGSGFQIKMLDALARGKPVVSTRYSNCLGSAISDADNAHDLADLINKYATGYTPGGHTDFDYNKFHTQARLRWQQLIE